LTPDDLDAVVEVARALPPADVAILVTAVQQGPQSLHAVRTKSAGALREACSSLIDIGKRTSLAEISGVLQGAANVSRDMRNRIDLVWTGPDVPGSVSRLTSGVIADLVDQARADILLISYAMHTEPTLTAALTRAVQRGVFVQVVYERAVDNPHFSGVQVPFPGLKVRRLCWPIDQRPAGASMHAKALVIDRKLSLIGSANITGTAMLRNLECGVLLHDPAISAEIVGYIESLLSRKILQECLG
jgi:cardiolipin synthase A/B